MQYLLLNAYSILQEYSQGKIIAWGCQQRVTLQLGWKSGHLVHILLHCKEKEASPLLGTSYLSYENQCLSMCLLLLSVVFSDNEGVE